MLISTRETVRNLLAAAVEAAVTSGALSGPRAFIAIERPKQAEHGGFATNVALLLPTGPGTPPTPVAVLPAYHPPTGDAPPRQPRSRPPPGPPGPMGMRGTANAPKGRWKFAHPSGETS